MDIADGKLPCGRAVEEIWNRLDQPPDAHEAECSYCRDALEGLSEVAEATQDWAAQEEEISPPEQVKETIMAVVNAELRQGRRVMVERNEIGEISIREAALSAIVRDAAALVPGVHPRRTIVRAEEPLVLDVSVSVAAAVLTPAVAGAIRAAVLAAVTAELQQQPTVNLIVEDVHDER